jgi:N-acetylglutamate synthase-like GNAT family acetyltransferase
MDTPVEIRRATAEDIPQAREFYTRRGYGGGIAPEDAVLLAEQGGDIVGIVRLAPEEGEIVLRGMQVHPTYQRQGIGLQFLAALANELGNRTCFCIPYAHLEDFYGRIGFAAIDLADAPPFLRSRVEGYRVRFVGKQFLLMRREAQAHRQHG